MKSCAMPPRLTIGMATFDDFDGVYFSVQALRMYHSEVINDIEIIVIDNNPDGNHGQAIRNLKDQAKIKYIPFGKYKSTAVRNLIFENASAPYVVSMDCHVLFESGSLKKLLDVNCIVIPHLRICLKNSFSIFIPVRGANKFR